MRDNFKKVLRLCGAFIYAYIVILLTKKFVVPLVAGKPAWVSWMCFIFTMLPVFWLLAPIYDADGIKKDKSDSKTDH